MFIQLPVYELPRKLPLGNTVNRGIPPLIAAYFSYTKPALQHYLALPRSVASILDAFRRILSIFIALSLSMRVPGRCSTGSLAYTSPAYSPFLVACGFWMRSRLRRNFPYG